MNIFKKKTYISIPAHQTDDTAPSVPDGMWVQCGKCKRTIYKSETGRYKICPNCGAGFRLTAPERLELTADAGTFAEFGSDILARNPLDFKDYDKKLEVLYKETGLNAAVVTGCCEIGGVAAVLCIMDTRFIMGSLGSAEGEKLTEAFERALAARLPVIVFAASGGARMQEGIVSLMQMAKVSAAVKRHSDAGLLYVTVLTDPTTGGVAASFAMLGDIILAEPKALIGFAGPRVIEQTVKQKLPEGFQTSEFLLERGFIDKIVRRQEMRDVLAHILKLHEPQGEGGEPI